MKFRILIISTDNEIVNQLIGHSLGTQLAQATWHQISDVNAFSPIEFANPELVVFHYEGLNTIRNSVHTIRESFASKPIILLTKNEENCEPENHLKWGIHEWLTKEEISGRSLVKAVIYAKERCQLENQLIHSQTQFQLAVEGSLSGIWDFYDPIEGKIWCSKRFYEILGFEDQEILFDRNNILEYIHSEDRENAAQQFRDFLNGQIFFVQEFKMLTKSGSYIWVRTNAKASFDEHGTLIKVVGTITDISKRKLVELQLAESEERFNLAVQSTEAALWDRKIEGTDIKEWWSEELYKMLEYSPQTIAGSEKTLENLIHPSDFHRHEIELQRHLTDKNNYRSDLHFKTGAGNYKLLRFSIKTIVDEFGKPIRMVGLLFDLSDKSYAEEQINKSRLLFQQMTEDSPASIFIIQDKKVAYLNPVAKMSLGVSQDELNELDFIHLILKEDQKKVLIESRELLTGNKTVAKFDIRLRGRNKKTIYANVTCNLIEFKGEKAILGVGIDITARKLALDDLKKNQYQMQIAQKIARFASFEYNPKTDVFKWSPNAQKLLQSLPLTLSDFNNTLTPSRLNDFQSLSDQLSNDLTIESEVVLNSENETRTFLLHIFQETFDNQLFNTIYGTIQDITEIKETQEALIEQKAFTESILNNLPTDIAVLDTQNRYLYVNKWAIRNEENRKWIIGKTDFDLAGRSPKHLPAAIKRQEIYNRIKETGKAFDWVDQIEHSGKTEFIYRSLYPYFESGKLKYLFGYGVDITSQKMAEEKLKTRLEFEKLIIELSNKLVNIHFEQIDYFIDYALNSIGEKVNVDRISICQIHDNRRSAKISHSWEMQPTGFISNKSDQIPLVHLKWLLEQFKAKPIITIHNANENEDLPSGFREFCIRRKSSSLIIIPLTSNRVTSGLLVFEKMNSQKEWESDFGDLLQITSQVFINAFEKKKAHGALYSSERKFRTLTESANAAIFITQDLRFVYANHATEELTGYSSDQLLSMSLLDVFDNSEWESALNNAELLQKGKSSISRNERKIKTLSGQPKFIDITSNIIEYNSKKALISIAIDITEKKKADSEKTILIEKLTQQNSDLEQFSYIISHNLRSPVAGIQGLVQIFDEESLGNEFNREVFTRIAKTANNLDQTIKELNDVIAVKERSHDARQKVEFSKILKTFKENHTNLIEKSKATIIADFRSAESIISVKGYVESIFTNLLINALKYRRADVSPIVLLKSKLIQNQIIIVVSDNGMGIDLDKFGSKLFKFKQRFHLHIEGTGLGLYLVKTQVETLNGTIEVQSKVNEGTRFIIKLPRPEIDPIST